MADEDAESSPSTDQASTQTEGPGVGLAAALDAAFDEVGLGDDKPKEPEKVEQPEGEEPKEKEQEPGKPAEPKEAPAPKATAPAQWDAASKAKFDKLPDSAKSIVLDLAKFQEADYTRKTTELANVRRYAEAISSLITDEHRQQMRAQGLNEVQAFERLLQYQDFALRKPADYVRWFAQAANLQPAAIFPELATGVRPAGQPQQPAKVDPQLLNLQRYVERIGGWVNQSQREREQERQQVQQQNESAAMSTIEQFRSAVDDKGQPLRPHMAQVEDAMTEILQTNRSVNRHADPMVRLQKAYAMAVAQDEELNKLATEAAAARLRSSEQRSKDVARAKAATAPINATAQVSEGSPGKLPLKDWVAKSMEEVLGH